MTSLHSVAGCGKGSLPRLFFPLVLFNRLLMSVFVCVGGKFYFWSAEMWDLFVRKQGNSENTKVLKITLKNNKLGWVFFNQELIPSVWARICCFCVLCPLIFSETRCASICFLHDARAKGYRPGVVANNLYYQFVVTAGGFWVWGQPGLHSWDHLSKKGVCGYKWCSSPLIVPFSMAVCLLCPTHVEKYLRRCLALPWYVGAQHLEIRPRHQEALAGVACSRVTRPASCPLQVALGDVKTVSGSLLDLCPDLHLFCCVSFQLTISVWLTSQIIIKSRCLDEDSTSYGSQQHWFSMIWSVGM